MLGSLLSSAVGWLVFLTGLWLLGRRFVRRLHTFRSAPAAAPPPPPSPPEEDDWEIDPDSLAPMTAPTPPGAQTIASPESLMRVLARMAELQNVPDPQRQNPPVVVMATARLVANELEAAGFALGSRRQRQAARACYLALHYSSDERRVQRN
ncbi:MAG: hypothetical protein ABSB24_02285 [Gaiellaceae bacterium]